MNFEGGGKKKGRFDKGGNKVWQKYGKGERNYEFVQGKFTQKESWSEMKEPTKTRQTPLTVCKYLV